MARQANTVELGKEAWKMPSTPPPGVVEALISAGMTGSEAFLRSLVFPNVSRNCDACSSWTYSNVPAVARIRGMDGSRSTSFCARHVAEYAGQWISEPLHDLSSGHHNNFGHLGTCAVCAQPGFSRYYPGRQYPGLTEYVHTSCSATLNRCGACGDYRMPGDDTVCCAPGTRCLNCRDRYSRQDSNRWGAMLLQAGGHTLADGRDSRDLDWCTRCFNDSFSPCTDCNLYVTHGRMYSRMNDTRLCHTCFDGNESYERCSRHGFVFVESTGPECCAGGAELINSYSFRPRLRFRGDGPVFLGMELEIESNVDRYTLARVARDGFGPLVFMKEDGSIRSGFEMVTHPMTAAWFVENYSFSTLEALESSGGYAASNCGIHVHVNKAGFSGQAHDFRWLAFMAKNEAAITTLARRSSSYARFGTMTTRDRKLIATKKHSRSYDRYSAVNVNNEHTYEVRVFASSLRPQTVAASLLFVDASVEYTRQLRAATVIRSNGWGWAAFVAWLETAGDKYSMLRAELTELGIGMPADPAKMSTLDNLSANVPDIRYGDDDDDDSDNDIDIDIDNDIDYAYVGCRCDQCRPPYDSNDPF